jgi:acetyl esterase/lipase
MEASRCRARPLPYASKVPSLFMAAGLLGLAFTVNAFLPLSNRRALFFPSFVFSWLTMELAAHHLVWQAIAAWVFIELGALQAWPGWVGLGVSLLSWAGLLVLVLQGRRARDVMARLLEGFISTPTEHRISPWRLLVPVPFSSAQTRRIRNVVYGHANGRALRLDVYLPRRGDGRRPAVVQIHGGGWIVGDKRSQGIPLLLHLCDRGWVGFNVNYRLSPAAAFPDHLVDIKRAIAWVRDHADDYGVDPSFIAVTGGSAGGHLAALAALTNGDGLYQPGFEDADVSVQACVPLYAIYDLTDRLGLHHPRFVSRFVGPLVLHASFEADARKFHEASPLDRVHERAPPFFVIHGDRDSMAPLRYARLFVQRLREVSGAPVLAAEIRGAQHAFDLFLSPRSAAVIEGVGAFLDETYLRHQRAKASKRLGVEVPAGPRGPEDGIVAPPG